MSNKTERKNILGAIEDEYRHDLAIHLYSSFLLHKVNPMFPRRNWASWPLPLGDIPEPSGVNQYEDGDILDTVQFKAPYIEAEADTDADHTPAIDGSDSGLERSSSIESSTSSPRDASASSGLAEAALENGRHNLMIEIIALLQRTIRKKALARQGSHKTAPVLEPNPTLLLEAARTICSRIDGTFNKLASTQNHRRNVKESEKPSVRLLTWQDVLLAALDSHNELENGKDIDGYIKAYKKCERLFSLVNYKYEYNDNSEDSDSSSEEYIDSLSENIPANNDGIPNFTAENHLEVVEGSSSSFSNGQNFKERMLHNMKKERGMSDVKKLLFYNKAHSQLQDKQLSSMSRRKARGTHSKAKKMPKKFKISNQGLHNQKKNALKHGGISLDSDDYKVEV
ncbi:Piso0_003952 [Millerozyma farinosa CBS 7064]|uniref:Piso0_003952 protein n=1 Tax=Pichia sorbitophila (strain ATCC MYA-4447 / BCRC 22081 / CBS 7064 / NBRC 10061 / NRRL Y-12695) TaxID=559304 RepID=G8Y728_PICSO|nr:Piso0_003952 [Millerozyma farinosa CBS 7064]CCE84408.1 Piso0_003952 [Millerozyma farinosa CBS 7064]